MDRQRDSWARWSRVATWVMVSLVVGISNAAAQEEAAFLAKETVTAEQVTAVSTTGTEILADVKAARAAIQRGNAFAARSKTAQARGLVERLRYVSPAVRVQDKIARALGLARQGKVGPDAVLPIVRELEAVGDVEQLVMVRRRVDAAHKAAEQGEQQMVIDALSEASAHITYLEIDLPIDETYIRLGRASHQLQRKQLMAADATLEDVT